MSLSKKLWKALNGVVCVYKPADVSVSAVRKHLQKKIVSEGNEVVGWPTLPTIELPVVESHAETGASLVVGTRQQIDYSCHPLVVGEAFRTEDLRIEELQYMESTSSGVCLFGLNDGCDALPELMSKSWLNEYRLEGILGRETHKHDIKGRVTIKADYDHVTYHRISSLLSRIQAQYRRAAFETAEVDLQSEEAFELALKGLPRAQLPGAQIIYHTELKLFRPPYFVLNVSVVGETDVFMRCFVHEIGVCLGTTASCIRLQRLRQGPFGAKDALLEKQFSLQNILSNIKHSRDILSSTSTDSAVIDHKEKLADSQLHGEVSKRIVDGLGINSQDMEDAMRPAWPRNYDVTL